MSESTSHPAPGRLASAPVAPGMYDVDSSDPDSVLLDRSGLSPADIAQINALMAALAHLRRAEDALSDASTRYMRLNRTDMRALHYLIVRENLHQLSTPGDLASHLGITTASTTKLLDRLARGGHITRTPHPTDRRALVVHVTAETRRSAMETVGRQQAKRFSVAARRTPEERAIITAFLEDSANGLSMEGVDWAVDDHRA